MLPRIVITTCTHDKGYKSGMALLTTDFLTLICVATPHESGHVVIIKIIITAKQQNYLKKLIN